MRLTYQTGIAALIQLAVMTLLNIANGLTSSVQQCVANSSDCVGDIILAMLYFMALTIWLTALWILATATQTQRSRKLAVLLIGGEFLVFAVASFNAMHHNNLLGLVTSLADALFAAWVGILAFRIFISGGGRVTASQRSRRRRLSRL